MDREFSCPCIPELNGVLISFIFIGPSVCALTLMMFFKRPCMHKSNRSSKLAHFVDVFLPLLVPPLVWMFLLLFEGEYIACAVTRWKGDYELDEEIKIKWCKPRRLNETGVSEINLRDQTELMMFYSQITKKDFLKNVGNRTQTNASQWILSLALLLVFCVVAMVIVIYRDCTKLSERLNEATQLSETLHSV